MVAAGEVAFPVLAAHAAGGGGHPVAADADVRRAAAGSHHDRGALAAYPAPAVPAGGTAAPLADALPRGGAAGRPAVPAPGRGRSGELARRGPRGPSPPRG